MSVSSLLQSGAALLTGRKSVAPTKTPPGAQPPAQKPWDRQEFAKHTVGLLVAAANPQEQAEIMAGMMEALEPIIQQEQHIAEVSELMLERVVPVLRDPRLQNVYLCDWLQRPQFLEYAYQKPILTWLQLANRVIPQIMDPVVQGDLAYGLMGGWDFQTSPWRPAQRKFVDDAFHQRPMVFSQQALTMIENVKDVFVRGALMETWLDRGYYQDHAQRDPIGLLGSFCKVAAKLGNPVAKKRCQSHVQPIAHVQLRSDYQGMVNVRMLMLPGVDPIVGIRLGHRDGYRTPDAIYREWDMQGRRRACASLVGYFREASTQTQDLNCIKALVNAASTMEGKGPVLP